MAGDWKCVVSCDTDRQPDIVEYYNRVLFLTNSTGFKLLLQADMALRPGQKSPGKSFNRNFLGTQLHLEKHGFVQSFYSRRLSYARNFIEADSFGHSNIGLAAYQRQ